MRPTLLSQLAVFLVVFVLRHLAPGLEVEPVRAPEDAAAVFLKALGRVFFDPVYRLRRAVLIEGRELREALPVLREADGYDGDAVHAGVELRELAHGAGKLPYHYSRGSRRSGSPR